MAAAVVAEHQLRSVWASAVVTQRLSGYSLWSLERGCACSCGAWA